MIFIKNTPDILEQVIIKKEENEVLRNVAVGNSNQTYSINKIPGCDIDITTLKVQGDGHNITIATDLYLDLGGVVEAHALQNSTFNIKSGTNIHGCHIHKHTHNISANVEKNATFYYTKKKQGRQGCIIENGASGITGFPKLI